MVTLASTCRKDPRTAETIRKGCGNGAERLWKDRGNSARTKLQDGNTAEMLRKDCGNIMDTMRNTGGPAADARRRSALLGHHILYFRTLRASDRRFSLLPRPFPPPVFDRLQYAKTEGEGLGERVTFVTSGNVGGGVPDEESRGPSCNILSKNLRL